jgi:hypothetical protein
VDTRNVDVKFGVTHTREIREDRVVCNFSLLSAFGLYFVRTVSGVVNWETFLPKLLRPLSSRGFLIFLARDRVVKNSLS